MGLANKSESAQFIRAKGMRSSSALFAAIDAAIARLLEAACARAKENKRTTVLPQDV